MIGIWIKNICWNRFQHDMEIHNVDELVHAITTEPIPSLFQLVPSSPPMALWGKTVKNIEYFAIIIGGIKQKTCTISPETSHKIS